MGYIFQVAEGVPVRCQALTSVVSVLHPVQELFSVFFSGFIVLFPAGCSPATFTAVAFPLPGVWWAEQHQLWEGGRQSVCGLHCSGFIMFQRQDLMCWGSKRLLMPPAELTFHIQG